ncbi:MAG: peptidylprolyl isomerase [Bacteroidaceae bacterium]|nr:peptidylprolyl isomerase [Bacteroidaceae bacterium]MBR5276476.1 peptidylprolyl isomerase [Bacteroidaceae bacterium]
MKCNKVFGRLFLVALCLCHVANVFAQDNVIDRVEWVVGDKAILRSDIESAIDFWVENDRRFDGDPYAIVGEDLAVQQLFIHQAGLDSIVVGEMDIMRRVDAQMEKSTLRAGSKEKLEEYLEMSSAQIREMYYDHFKNSMLTDAVREKIIGDIKVSPSLVRKYYNTLPDDSIPYMPALVEVQIITQTPEIEQEEIERIKSELREYTERINNNETSFSTLALLYSEDGAARFGGELNFMGRGELAPEFAAVAFNLTDPNKVSKIVETEFGFHIMQLIEKRGDKVKVRHIVRKPQVSQNSIRQMLARLDTIREDIDSGRFTFEMGATQISHDKDTRNNNGVMFNSEQGIVTNSKFELQDLPVEVASAVAGMKVGEISKPFVMVKENGSTVCAIVKLKNRIEGHKANMRDDYEYLKELYAVKMGEEKVARWIKEKQKTTFVRINKEYRNSKFVYPDWRFYDEE